MPTPITEHLTVGNLHLRLTELMDQGVPCDAKVVVVCPGYDEAVESEQEMTIDEFRLTSVYPRRSLNGPSTPQFKLILIVD